MEQILQGQENPKYYRYAYFSSLKGVAFLVKFKSFPFALSNL